MLSNQIILLGLALAIDAAIVTFALSLLHEHEPFANKVKNGLIASSIFGLFQFAMIWFGSYAGYIFTFSGFGHYFQFIIGMIFFGLGFKCLRESLELQGRKVEWGILSVILLGFATSIDALASGISLGTIPEAHVPSFVVGVITFFLCSLFYLAGQFLGKVPDRWLLRFAGFIFTILGGQVFWSMRHIIFRGHL